MVNTLKLIEVHESIVEEVVINHHSHRQSGHQVFAFDANPGWFVKHLS